jgi:hypothetical protein
LDNVTRTQLIDGFSDKLLVQDIPSEEHLYIEKTMLYLSENKRIGKAHRMIGLLKMSKLLNEPRYHNLMINSYGIDDRWFHNKMGEIDTLQPRALEEIKGRTRLIRTMIKRFIRLFRRNKV